MWLWFELEEPFNWERILRKVFSRCKEGFNVYLLFFPQGTWYTELSAQNTAIQFLSINSPPSGSMLGAEVNSLLTICHPS